MNEVQKKHTLDEVIYLPLEYPYVRFREFDCWPENRCQRIQGPECSLQSEKVKHKINVQNSHHLDKFTSDGFEISFQNIEEVHLKHEISNEKLKEEFNCKGRCRNVLTWVYNVAPSESRKY